MKFDRNYTRQWFLRFDWIFKTFQEILFINRRKIMFFQVIVSSAFAC